MREIKFRAWFIDGKFKQLHSQVCSMQEDRTLLEFLQDIEDCKKEHGYNVILMQYTGLKDKNGVEIYEGDVVQLNDIDEGKKCVVRWDNKECRVAYGDKRFPIHCYTCKVIGNVHKNPELTEKENA